MTIARGYLRTLLLAAAAAALGAGRAGAATRPPTVTIYSAGADGAAAADAWVTQVRRFEATAGLTLWRLSDIAAGIDPSSVRFESVTDPAHTRVVEQVYRNDLQSGQGLLSQFVGRSITVEPQGAAPGGAITGTLRGAGTPLVVESRDGSLHVFDAYSSLSLPDRPEGLATRPTLIFEIRAPRAGAQQALLSYATSGMSWSADYDATFKPGASAQSGTIDFGAWAAIVNRSGAAFDGAVLKLVAGAVHGASPAAGPLAAPALARVSAQATGVRAGFAQAPLAEYHVYTLRAPADLPNDAVSRLELIERARGVPARKVLIYDGAASESYGGGVITDRDFGATGRRQVDAFLEFKNDAASGLGIPLPGGRIRVFSVDRADQSPQFVGADQIRDTPKGETVRIKLGEAFDVVGERKQVDFKIDARQKWIEEEFEIAVRNHTPAAVDVLVRENLYRSGSWSILSSTVPFEKKDARRVAFPLRVPADGVRTLRYRVRYTW